MIYYAPSTGGFYSTDLHDEIPADAVKITAKKHAELLAAQALGATIVPGPKGPIAKLIKASRDDLLAREKRRVKREAGRRILAVASIEQQLNDNAAIALAALQAATEIGMTIDVGPAIERRRQVDAIRAASNEIELQLASLSAAELAAFRAAEAAWPTN